MRPRLISAALGTIGCSSVTKMRCGSVGLHMTTIVCLRGRPPM